MKKITTFCCLLAIMFSLVTFNTGCKEDENLIKISEVTHSIFYAPLYIAKTCGFFEEQGLSVELTNAGGSDKVMSSILSGDAHIGLMGPEATIYTSLQNPTDSPIIFGALTKRDGSFIMSKNKINNFKWSDLIGHEIIGGRKGGVPAMVLEYAMKQGGLHPGNELSETVDTILNTDVQFNLVASTFESKSDAFCTMFEPTASEYNDSGRGYIVASLGALTGEIPYTSFTAKSSYLKNHSEVAIKFLTAIIKAYNYITPENLDTISTSLVSEFASTSKESIKKALQSYINIDAWYSTPVMKESELSKLEDIIISAGELKQKVDFNSVVDNSFALSAISRI